MPFQPGNQIQSADNSRLGRRLLTKTRSALDKAIDGLGDAEKNGATAMAELITDALRKDVVGTLSRLSSYMPRELHVDVNNSMSALQMSDEQLLEIIKSRSLPTEKVIEGQLIEAETGKNGQEVTNSVINDSETGHY